MQARVLQNTSMNLSMGVARRRHCLQGSKYTSDRIQTKRKHSRFRHYLERLYGKMFYY